MGLRGGTEHDPRMLPHVTAATQPIPKNLDRRVTGADRPAESSVPARTSSRWRCSPKISSSNLHDPNAPRTHESQPTRVPFRGKRSQFDARGKDPCPAPAAARPTYAEARSPSRSASA